MKKIIILSLILFFVKKNSLAQSQTKFDILKVYSMSYYSESAIKIDASLLMLQGDTTVITDTSLINRILEGLLNMKKRASNEYLKNLRKKYNKYSIDVRAVFIFSSNVSKKTIGISRQSLMFVNNTVFEKKDIALEDIVKPSSALYKSLFPTREEIINK
jgi:hypothetical protein